MPFCRKKKNSKISRGYMLGKKFIKSLVRSIVSPFQLLLSSLHSLWTSWPLFFIMFVNMVFIHEILRKQCLKSFLALIFFEFSEPHVDLWDAHRDLPTPAIGHWRILGEEESWSSLCSQGLRGLRVWIMKVGGGSEKGVSRKDRMSRARNKQNTVYTSMKLSKNKFDERY